MAMAERGLHLRPDDRPLGELRGVVERITYQNAENGFTVARLAPERPEAEAEAEAARGEDRLVTVVGTLADLTPGEASCPPHAELCRVDAGLAVNERGVMRASAARLGHAVTQTIYAHRMQGADDLAATAIGRLFEEPGEGVGVSQG